MRYAIALAVLALALMGAAAYPTNLCTGDTVTAHDTTVYVNSVTGSDLNACTTAAKPCKTFAAAVCRVPRRVENAISIAADTFSTTAAVVNYFYGSGSVTVVLPGGANVSLPVVAGASLTVTASGDGGQVGATTGAPTVLHCTGDAGTCILTPGIEVPRLDDWGGFNVWGGGLSLYSDHTGANYEAIWVTPQLSPSVREYVGTLDGGIAKVTLADNPNADAVEELACGNANNVVSRVDCRGTMSIAGQLCFGFGNDAGCQSAPSTGPGLSKTIGGTCSGVFVNGVATSCTCTGAVDAGTNCH